MDVTFGIENQQKQQNKSKDTVSVGPRFREKLSLKKITEGSLPDAEVTELIKKTQNFTRMNQVEFPEKQIREVVKKYSIQKEQLFQNFTTSESFVRGEIEDEQVLNRVLVFLQVSLLESRLNFYKKQDLRAKEELQPWLMFAADFPYEESSLVALRFCNVVRSFIFDDIEQIQKNWPQRWAQDQLWFSWSQQIRVAWPIDRVVLNESKKVLSQRLMRVAQDVALQLQKNQYQNIETVLTQVRGGKAKDLQFLRSLWRDQDIQSMKTEVTRLSAIRLRLAQAIYEQSTGQKLSKLEELVSAQIIQQIPLNYLTGKPFDLAATALQ